jgi:hypothetical protein
MSPFVDAALAVPIWVYYAEWIGAYLPFRPDPTPPRARAWHTVCRRYRSWRAWRRIVRKSGGCR